MQLYIFSKPVPCLDLQRSAVCKVVTEQPILWRDCHSNQAINCVICLYAWRICCSIVSPMPHAVSSRKNLSQSVWNPAFYSLPPWHCFKIDENFEQKLRTARPKPCTWSKNYTFGQDAMVKHEQLHIWPRTRRGRTLPNVRHDSHNCFQYCTTIEQY